jgi:LDH2 family malate/lactate/ureidoglycolate dehydrogenase
MAAQVTNQIIEYVHDAKASGDQRVRYPGERTLEIRKQNLAEGVPVEAQIWQALQDM